MGKHQNALYKKLADSVEERMAEKSIEGEEGFPTRAELAAELGVSELTAYRVIKELSSRGLLITGRGRRAIVSTREPIRKQAKVRRKNLCIIYAPVDKESETNGFPIVMNFLLEKLRSAGNIVMDVSANEFMEEDPFIYDGIIVMMCYESIPELYERLISMSIPFAGCAFSRIMANCVSITSRCYAMESSLFIMRSKATNVLAFQLCDSTIENYLEKSHDLLIDDCLYEYRYECPVKRITPSELPSYFSDEHLLKLIEKNNLGKVAIFCKNYILSKRIYNLLNSKGWRQNKDYILISYGTTEAAEKQFPIINFKLKEYAERAIEILYRQLDAETAHDVGCIHQPTLELYNT